MDGVLPRGGLHCSLRLTPCYSFIVGNLLSMISSFATRTLTSRSRRSCTCTTSSPSSTKRLRRKYLLYSFDYPPPICTLIRNGHRLGPEQRSVPLCKITSIAALEVVLWVGFSRGGSAFAVLSAEDGGAAAPSRRAGCRRLVNSCADNPLPVPFWQPRWSPKSTGARAYLTCAPVSYFPIWM